MIRFLKPCAFSVVITAVTAVTSGCTPTEANRFREALPVGEDIALRVPGETSAGTGKTSQGLHIATNTPAGTSARYYQMTRGLTASVDLATAVILGGIWTIANTEPTSLEDRKAVWAPTTASGLQPAIWRFVVTQVGDAEYDYALEGQPRAGGAWSAALTGHGYGKSRPEHKMGWFKADNDAYRKLEPALATEGGTTKVTYDLRTTPATIAVELRPHADLADGWIDLAVTHLAGGAGSVTIGGLADIDEKSASRVEDIRLVSRWAADGSGRADVVMKGGDLPFVVDASECWSSSFVRVFYKDTVDFEPATGAAASCTFPATTF